MASPSRRLPPPCWSHAETLALIASYAATWHSLSGTNLRSPHWDHVSSAVSRICPSSLPKTPLQCRHKIEKLRKRYRSENQRPRSLWPYFPAMDAMERGDGVRSKVVGLRPSPRVSGRDDVAAVIGVFGEGFLRMEGAKLEAGREVERMRMDGELKRTEMVLGFQRRIVEAMVHRCARGGISENGACEDGGSREVEKMRMDVELKRNEMVLDCQRRIIKARVHRLLG